MSLEPTEKMLVTFWGTRGSIPTPGRHTEKYGGNTSCIAVRHGKEYVIIDAGSGIRNLGVMLAPHVAAAKDPIRFHLFLSHTHWDHIQGLPFFAPAYMPGVELYIYGSPSKEHLLEDILSGQMDWNYFPVDMSTFAAGLSFHGLPDDPMMIGDMCIEWQEQLFHPGGCVRFRVSVGDRSVVYASDIELESMFAVTDPSDEIRHFRKEYLEFVGGTNLLIADGQYTEEEYASKVGWGHTSIPLAIDVARQARVKQIGIFHHEPVHTDRQLDELQAMYGQQNLQLSPEMTVFWAREGLTLAL